MSLTVEHPPKGVIDAARPSVTPDKPAVVTRPAARPRPWPELALIAILFLAYKLARVAADGHVADAYVNADRVWTLERSLHLPDEAAIQHLLLHGQPVAQAANGFYAYVHFPATAAFLLWIYLRRPTHYRWIRRTLAALTAAGLAVHLLFPLAPPRMLTRTGLIDTAARYGPSVYGSPETDTLTNQYAAMPSLHVGWALVVALGLIIVTRSRWRWLWLAHPAATTVVVVGTANHYWLDAIAASALLAGGTPPDSPGTRPHRVAHHQSPLPARRRDGYRDRRHPPGQRTRRRRQNSRDASASTSTLDRHHLRHPFR